MPITPDQTTFRRLQTDDPATVTVFLSIDGQLIDGTPQPGPWREFRIVLTPEEQAASLAIVARARQQFADQINNPAPAAPAEEPQP